MNTNEQLGLKSVDGRRVPLDWHVRTKSSLSMLLNMPDTWLKLAGSKFACAEQEPDIMGKRLIENGAKNCFNCAHELKLAIEDGQPAFDLLSEVIKQDAESPRSRWFYDIILSFLPDAFVFYAVGKILARPSEP